MNTKETCWKNGGLSPPIMSLPWKDLPWKDIQIEVYKLQKQIYYSSLENKTELLWETQKRLTYLSCAKLLAVRRVTQDNRGKNTAGTDGAKTLTPVQRMELAQTLELDGSADSIRRVLIPKSTSGELRPLGIPTIRDRAKQALALMALEPQWEAQFEPNSYGFRPGRSCHDAIEAIFNSIAKKSKYVLDADIAKCFDRINHQALLDKMNTFPDMKKQIKAWLKAGILDRSAGETLFPEEGTPQGGVISPLLANIALHGMETELKNWIRSVPMRDKKGKVISPKNKENMLSLIRYADDFVLIHPDLNIVLEAKEKIEVWLLSMGLKLHPTKTSLKHTFLAHGTHPPGFDFLGFNVRQYRVGRFHQTKSALPFKTLIKPSANSILRHLRQIKGLLRRLNKVEAVVAQLNPIIRGWSYYYRTVVSSEIFSKIEKKGMIKLIKWCKKKHRTRTGTWIYDRYLKRVDGRLRFGYYQHDSWCSLMTHSDVKIIRHIKVSGSKSPYNVDWTYWAIRGQRMFQHTPRFKTILKQQEGRCAWCNLYFTPSDIVEMDHITPRKIGGKSKLGNLQLLHGHCHDQKTAEDTSTRARDADVGQPDEYSVIRKLTAKGALGAG
jgi:RNA-directed DNA polymerase